MSWFLRENETGRERENELNLRDRENDHHA